MSKRIVKKNELDNVSGLYFVGDTSRIIHLLTSF